MSKYTLIKTLLLTALLTCPFPLFAFGIGLTPSTIEMDVKPGSHHRQVLKVKNFNQDKPIRLSVSIADWTLDETGQVELLPPAESERSASEWITFSPSVLVLEPNTSSNIAVDITTPLDISSNGDHRTSIILSTMLPSKKDRDGQNGVWNRYQIASLFYANVLPGEGKPVITNAAFTPNAMRKEHNLAFNIENQGLRHTRIEGSVILQNQENESIVEQSFKTVLLDKQSREFNLSFGAPELVPGEYSVRFDIKGDGKTIPMSVDQRPFLKIN